MVMQLPGTYVLIAPFELPTSVPRPHATDILRDHEGVER